MGKSDKEALKYDQGKVPLHLIDPLWLETTARVLDFGQKKYAAWNWANGTFDWSRLYGALQRHLNAWWAGEEHDPETGMSHLWHANCCMMFLTRYAASHMGQDDRPHLLPKWPTDTALKTIEGEGPAAYDTVFENEIAKLAAQSVKPKGEWVPGGYVAPVVTNTPRAGETAEQTAARTNRGKE